VVSHVQRKLYDFLIKFLGKNGFQPSMREMARGMGWRSAARTQQVLRELAAEGWIEMLGPRSIRLFRHRVVVLEA
jgi:SOS-response transcriptional repressor LexA